jgi:hypothetical protein
LNVNSGRLKLLAVPSRRRSMRVLARDLHLACARQL